MSSSLDYRNKLRYCQTLVAHVRTSLQNSDDVLWKDAGCTSELDYTEQASWLLFLKYLDALEADKATEAALNRCFVKFLLSRITGFIEQQSGASTNFSTYFVSPGTKPYEVEHIWADKFEEHRDEFEQRHAFDNYRNRIGDLVLLPQGTNQSYGAMTYAEKIEHYLKENLLVKSLHAKAYENNPNFVGTAKNLGLKFKAHKAYAKADIDERMTLIQSICEAIWGT